MQVESVNGISCHLFLWIQGLKLIQVFSGVRVSKLYPVFIVLIFIMHAVI